MEQLGSLLHYLFGVYYVVSTVPIIMHWNVLFYVVASMELYSLSNLVSKFQYIDFFQKQNLVSKSFKQLGSSAFLWHGSWNQSHFASSVWHACSNYGLEHCLYLVASVKTLFHQISLLQKKQKELIGLLLKIPVLPRTTFFFSVCVFQNCLVSKTLLIKLVRVQGDQYIMYVCPSIVISNLQLDQSLDQ